MLTKVMDIVISVMTCGARRIMSRQ
jgi:hypothetical protein